MRRRLYFVWMIILWGCVPESTSGTDSENVSGQSSMGMPSPPGGDVSTGQQTSGTGEETAGQAALVSGGRMMTDNHGGRATPSDDWGGTPW